MNLSLLIGLAVRVRIAGAVAVAPLTGLVRLIAGGASEVTAMPADVALMPSANA